MSRFRALGLLLVMLWAVEAINFLSGHTLNRFGLLPRHLSGIPGIMLAPLLHGGFAHLLSNTLGLAGLGGLVAVRGERHFLLSTFILVVLSGGLLWVFGRPAVHVGASGLVFAYFGLLLGRAWHQRTWDTIAIAAVVVFFYGGLIAGLSPLQRYISWDGHLAGLLAGLAVAWWRRPVDSPKGA